MNSRIFDSTTGPTCRMRNVCEPFPLPLLLPLAQVSKPPIKTTIASCPGSSVERPVSSLLAILQSPLCQNENRTHIYLTGTCNSQSAWQLVYSCLSVATSENWGPTSNSSTEVPASRLVVLHPTLREMKRTSFQK